MTSAVGQFWLGCSDSVLGEGAVGPHADRRADLGRWLGLLAAPHEPVGEPQGVFEVAGTAGAEVAIEQRSRLCRNGRESGKAPIGSIVAR